MNERVKVGPNRFIVGLCLFFLTLFAQSANQIYLSYSSEQEVAVNIPLTLGFLSVLTIPALWIGLVLGSKLGLGLQNTQRTDQLDFNGHSQLDRKPREPALRFTGMSAGIVYAISFGVFLGVLLLLLRDLLHPYLPQALPEYGFRGLEGGILVSFGAAVGEEVWFRFGLLTLVLYIFCQLTGKIQPSEAMVKLAIVFIATLFGLAHLPQLAAFQAFTNFAIWATILGNILVGSLYGWCFWRFGLVSAIVAHFSVDIVLHVLPATALYSEYVNN
ncbi:CPBP family intramembrane metalloprotease [Thalassotalea euphylliae]|uniref:CPBP family intramembrane metalloprotease n=2 Tax=Thalassotalea euphylliae TaxID=1655234 RepID=A0A3E0UEU7_9GAMM|nr:CPBP family intramembrane metalloprotease [Thalassotalea euphylliae]